MTSTVPSTQDASAGARRARREDEAPLTLEEPTTRSLGLLDQLGLWGNLGVSLLGFTGAYVVLFPLADGDRVSLLAALVATVVGTLVGTLLVALAALPGARTGAPSMVLLRGLFGAKASYVPTVLNVAQLVGWGTFEIVTIGAAAHQVAPDVPRWVFVVLAGVITTGLALRPLGAVRILRKYVTVLVVVALVYLLVQLLRQPMPSPTAGSWNGLGIGIDTTLAVAVSWLPVVSDYSRHSRKASSAFLGSFVGYSITQIACYAIGFVAILTVATTGDTDKIFGAFIAVPLGALAFAVLVTREIDQSFCNVYSTAVSTQNLRPRWDRRVLALVIGTATTLLALAIDIGDYASFLGLIGSVFVPMAGVLVVDYFCFRGHERWDLSESAPARPSMLVAWALGFVMYQLVYPGEISWWASMWGDVADAIGFHWQSWMSASLLSFVVAGAATAVVHGFLALRRVRPAGGFGRG